MRPPTYTRPLTKSAFVAGFAALLAGITTVHAQSVWDGGGTTDNWSDGPNWATNVAPISGASTDVQISGVTRLNSNVDSAFTLNSLTFTAGAGAFTLGGSSISISSASGQPTRITNSSASTQTINNSLNLSGVGIAANGGNMVINGGVTFGGNGFRLGAGSGRTLTMNGVISGAVSADTFAINASGTVVLGNGANTYTGNTQIWNGTVVAMGNAPAAFSVGGSGVFGNSGQTIALGIGSGNLTPTILTGGAYTIARSFQVNNTGAGSVFTLGGNTADISTFSGTILNGQASGAARALTLTAASGGRVNFNGNVQRASGATGSSDDLTKTGSGIVALAGSSNTYSGATTVSAGTLLVNGALASGGGAVAVGNTATLGGSGSISRVINVNSGGTLSPGDMSGGTSLTGILTANANVTLTDGSAFRASLAGTTAGLQHDQLIVGGSGTFSLTGSNNLVLDLTYTPVVGDKFTLVDVAGTSTLNTVGVFEQLNGVTTDLSQGAIFTLGGNQFQISYSAEGTTFSGAGNNVMLQVVPEPGSALLAGFGLCALLAGSRRAGRRAA